MSENDFRIKYSLRMRFLSSFVLIIACLITFLLIFNNFFGPAYYTASRKRHLIDAYNRIELELDKYTEGKLTTEQLEDNIEDITDSMEVHAIVVNSDWSIAFVNDYSDRFLSERLLASIMGQGGQLVPADNIEILDKTDRYTYQKLVGDSSGDDAYEVWGTFDNGYTVLCRFTTANITNSVRVINAVIQISGFILMAAAIVAALIVSKLITTPLKRLTGIASEMKELNFSARYTGNDTSEIGYLGNTMNQMSERLEDNIVKLKEANLELENDLRNKETVQEQQKAFLTAISHDLKTPIALVSGYAEAIRDGIVTDRESINEYCDIIIDESEKMNFLIRQLMSMNELESGKVQPEIERFCIVELLRAILNSNAITFNKNNIHVEFDRNEDEIYVWGDKMMVEQVIYNYITNAVNHCSGDRIIRISVERMDKVVRTHVWNSGSSIPESDIDEIWNIFYKADKARSRKYGGNGVGLAIVKTIMDLHGRECGAGNTDGGVDFWFDLDSEKNI